jgi:mRNA interferase RelE/StbE
MSGDPAEHGPYSVSLSGQARRNIREHLPLEVAAAAMETIEGSIAVNPYRAGKPLDEPFDGFYSARRGTYRIVYRIDEAKHQVEIYSIRHRRDASWRASPHVQPARHHPAEAFLTRSWKRKHCASLAVLAE